MNSFLGCVYFQKQSPNSFVPGYNSGTIIYVHMREPEGKREKWTQFVRVERIVGVFKLDFFLILLLCYECIKLKLKKIGQHV